MQPVGETTFKPQADNIEVIIGDEKQAEFYPRVKLKKWGNESNISVGFDDTPDGAIVTQDGEKVVFEKGDVTIEAFPLSGEKKPLTNIRRVLKGDEITAVGAAAEYEMFNQIGEQGEMLLAHYVVSEPSIAVFDLMPSAKHLDVYERDGRVYAKDFDYGDKSAYHPGDVPIPSYKEVAACRFYTPYNTYINPYYMDSGLHNIDINWKGSDFKGCINDLHEAIIEVFAGKGIEIIKAKDLNKQLRQKLYFRHGDRLVKFFSAQEEEKGLYAYININSAYNKAYDFYRPDVEKDIRNDYAYGIQQAYPEIDHSVVDEIMQVFATKIGLPLNDTPYNTDEILKWRGIQAVHSTRDWIADAKRKDANYIYTEPEDGFELLKILSTKPDSNEVNLTVNTPKGAVGYYQAEIPFEQQFAESSYRKPHVAKSIALYHPENRDNEYQSGKIAHIYRPFAWDASGLKVACHFKETEGLADGETVDFSNGLTIVLPQDFLDYAVYPITIDPTFGYTTAGGSTQTFVDTVLATSQATSTAGNLAAIVAYRNLAGGGTMAVEMALYNNSGSFSFLEETYNNSTDTGGTPAWVAMATESLYPLGASSTYQLAIWGTSSGGQGNVGNAYYDSTGGKTSYSLSSSYSADTWPTDLSGATTQSNRQYSIYAIYGKQWPIMVGSAVAMASSARYQPPMSTNDLAWNTTEANQQGLAVNTGAITRTALTLTTAPSAGNARTFTTKVNEVASTNAFTISDTATSGSDNTGAAIFVAGDRLSFANTPTGTATSSTINRWRFLQTSDYPTLYMTSGAVLNTTANRYTVVQGSGLNTSVGPVTQVFPEDATLQNFYLRLTASIASGSYTCTLVKNTVDTAVVITLDNANQQATYTATTIDVAPGDTFYWKIVPNTPASAPRLVGGCEYVSDVEGNNILLSNNSANASNSVTTYNNWYGDGVWQTTEAEVVAPAFDITVTKLYLLLSAQPGAGSPTKSRTVTFRDDGADTAASVAISGTGGTTGTWTGTVNVAADSLINVAHVPANTPAASSAKYGIVYNMTVASTAIKDMIGWGLGIPFLR